MRVVVTGAGGFLGQHVSVKLVDAGCDVVRIVRPGSVHHASLEAETLEIDLSQPGELERVVEKRVALLVHLAAVLPSSFHDKSAERAARINCAIDRNVFAACAASGVDVIYASGASVYGLGESTKSESSPVHPTGPYVQAKLEGERMGEEMLSRQGLTFTSLRISAPYGPGQRSRTVLNVFIDQAFNHRPLRYHGTGSRQQDFTYIDDVAKAACRAATKSKGGVYNIASGAPVTMRELAGIVVRCVPGCESEVAASGDADVQEGATALYSIEKAQRELEWQPTVSLEEGIRACVNSRLKEGYEDRISL